MAKGDVRALGGERERRGAADPARAASDQIDFSRELHAWSPCYEAMLPSDQPRTKVSAKFRHRSFCARQCPLWVTSGSPPLPRSTSALPREADIKATGSHFRYGT